MYPSLGTPSLGLGVRFRLRFKFSMLLASVVQPSTHFSCVSVTLQAGDELVFKSALVDL